ncbi:MULTISPECIES: FAD-dependent oxidoreductase [unclassified Sinorhizobium]|uniref:NAD(P)/FAD-dependent oxidoreductase n=1 Tax=unclassified Sinorhizobium TaxID=2613772 RepID=UPI0024C2613B|nr:MULTISPECIES: FAD-dependent oxidoreductase [unclassified Sinorhizobium]MDK1378158.1 FAD-dependent oxidoreductase [Sinorhizobium sp. 6-70]MDK1479793.1 FAD-dependent oxidoreductase [Sinorhizobium sp. 6-117]
MIIGGGVVGFSIGYGLLQRGVSVAILDGTDRDFSATRGNFGMVSVSNKGFNNIPYFRLSLASRNLWPSLADEVHDRSGINPHFEGRGKVYLSMGEQELADRVSHIQEFLLRAGDEYHQEILSKDDLDHLLGHVGLGDRVVGGAFSRLDGSVEPLQFYSGLFRAYLSQGGHYFSSQIVRKIVSKNASFSVQTPSDTFSAPKVVIASGLGTPPLASQIGLRLNVRPERGQIMVTERIERVFNYPISGFLRQNVEGTIMIGSSSEYNGFDDHTSVGVLTGLAKGAVERLPLLRFVQINRCWAALRPRTDDGYPIYQESQQRPGAFVVSCHSGITLAALHARLLPRWILDDVKDNLLQPFGTGRLQDECAT